MLILVPLKLDSACFSLSFDVMINWALILSYLVLSLVSCSILNIINIILSNKTHYILLFNLLLFCPLFHFFFPPLLGIFFFFLWVLNFIFMWAWELGRGYACGDLWLRDLEREAWMRRFLWKERDICVVKVEKDVNGRTKSSKFVFFSTFIRQTICCFEGNKTETIVCGNGPLKL